MSKNLYNEIREAESAQDTFEKIVLEIDPITLTQIEEFHKRIPKDCKTQENIDNSL